MSDELSLSIASQIRQLREQAGVSQRDMWVRLHPRSRGTNARGKALAGGIE